MTLMHKCTCATSVTDRTTSAQSAPGCLEMECDVTGTTLAHLCQLHLFPTLALCASVKTGRYAVTLPAWLWTPSRNADLRAAAMQQICLFSVLSSAPVSTRPRYLHRSCSASGLPSCLLCFLSLGRLGTVPLQTAFPYWPNHKLRMYHTETHRYCRGEKKPECDLDLLPDRKWEPSNPEKYINLGPLKANKHHLKYLSAFFKNQSQTKTRLISFSGSSFTCRMHCWMSPAGMWTRPWCWQRSQSCRLFAGSQSMFSCLKSELVGWILRASGDTGGVWLAKAREQLRRLEHKLQQEGNFLVQIREKDKRAEQLIHSSRGIIWEGSRWKALQ